MQISYKSETGEGIDEFKNYSSGKEESLNRLVSCKSLERDLEWEQKAEGR